MKQKKRIGKVNTFPVIINGEILALPIKHNTRGGKLVQQIPTPTCKDGLAPTFMATGYENASYKNSFSVGHFPKMIIVEVWELEEDLYMPRCEDFIFNSKDDALQSPFIFENEKKELYVSLPYKKNFGDELKKDIRNEI